MRRSWTFILPWWIAIATLDTEVQAQGPQSAVALGSVEAGVARVFAVQNVGTEEVRTREGVRVVAIPNMGHGTAFSVSGAPGVLLTAAHVVEDATYVVVRLPGEGTYYPARVAFHDEARDVAVLVIDGELPPLELQPATHVLRTRQNVFTVGYPLDASRSHPQSSRGIVGGAIEDGQLQLDMAVNPGNSGGPVIDEQDRVVGMVVARGDVERGVQGVAVAVPLATLHDAVARAQARLREGRVSALPSDAAQASRVIDTLSRVGLMRVLREASDVTEGTADTQAIQAVRSLNDDALSPDMRVFVAAFLWDAAQVLMYRAGDHVSPSAMQEGATRTLAQGLLDEARALLHSAAERDPTVADRSPFVRITTGGATAVSSETLRALVEAFPASSATPLPEVPESNWYWQTKRSWALSLGAGAGMGSYLGGGEEESYTRNPLAPGVAVRVFVGLRLTLVRYLSLLLEGDLLYVRWAELNENSSPEDSIGRFNLYESEPTFGGGLTLGLRVHIGRSPVFMGPGLRLGRHRYRGNLDSSSSTVGLFVIQPGFDLGVQLARVDTFLRFNIGIPEENELVGMYTALLHVSVALGRGDL